MGIDLLDGSLAMQAANSAGSAAGLFSDTLPLTHFFTVLVRFEA